MTLESSLATALTGPLPHDQLKNMAKTASDQLLQERLRINIHTDTGLIAGFELRQPALQSVL